MSSYLYQSGTGGRGGDGQPGIRAPMWAGLTMNSNLVPVANRAYLARFYTPRAMTIQSIAFIVATAATADDPCDVGIYTADATTRLVSKGATTGLMNTTGLKVVTVTPTALAANTAYYAVWTSTTPIGTVGQLFGVNLGNTSVGVVFGTAAGVAELAYKDSGSYPLSGTLVPFSGTTSGTPALYLREL